MRARVGVLEGVRGAVGDRLGSVHGDEPAWERFIRGRTHEDALSVREAELSDAAARWRIRTNMFIVQNNLANMYQALGREQLAQRMRQDVYSGRLELTGRRT